MSKRAKDDMVRVLNPAGSFDKVPFLMAVSMISAGRAMEDPKGTRAIVILCRDAISGGTVVRDSRSGYDHCAHRGMATIKQVKNVPVMAPLNVFVLPTKVTKRAKSNLSAVAGRAENLCATGRAATST